MVFRWSLGDSKSPKVSRIHLSILVNFKNAVDLKVSACLPISDSVSPFTKLLGDRSEIISYNWYVSQLHVPLFFFQFSGKVWVLFSDIFDFNTLVCADGKDH